MFYIFYLVLIGELLILFKNIIFFRLGLIPVIVVKAARGFA
jgi:hypothetical protein